MTETDESLLTVKQAAALAGVTDQTIRNYIRDGLLTGHYGGGGPMRPRRKVDRAELEALIRSIPRASLSA